MEGNKPVKRTAAYGEWNSNAHDVTIDISKEQLKANSKFPDGKSRLYLVDSEANYDRLGYGGISNRDYSMLKHDYNFDLAVTDFQTKNVVAVIEVIQLSGFNTKKDYNKEYKLRRKLKDCVENIPGLKHAYIVKIYGEINPMFEFVELVKTNVSVAGQNTNDGFSEMKVSDIYGVPTAEIEKQVKYELELRESF